MGMSLKTGFLLSVTSAKRVGELHALLTNSPWMQWWADDSRVTWWLNQSVDLAVFKEVDPIMFSWLCPIWTEQEPLNPQTSSECDIILCVWDK